MVQNPLQEKGSISSPMQPPKESSEHGDGGEGLIPVIYQENQDAQPRIVNKLSRNLITGYQNLANRIVESYQHHCREQHVPIMFRYPVFVLSSSSSPPWPKSRVSYHASEGRILDPIHHNWNYFHAKLGHVLVVNGQDNQATVEKEVLLIMPPGKFSLPMPITSSINDYSTFFRRLHLHLAALTGREPENNFNSKKKWGPYSLDFRGVNRILHPPLLYWLLPPLGTGIHRDVEAALYLDSDGDAVVIADDETDIEVHDEHYNQTEAEYLDWDSFKSALRAIYVRIDDC